MSATRLSSKGQVIIPKAVRDARGWKPGLDLEVVESGEGITLRPMQARRPVRAADLIGIAGYRGRIRSIEEMDEGVAAAISEPDDSASA